MLNHFLHLLNIALTAIIKDFISPLLRKSYYLISEISETAKFIYFGSHLRTKLLNFCV